MLDAPAPDLDGWSVLLWACVVGLSADEKRGKKLELVGGLKTLIEAAEEMLEEGSFSLLKNSVSGAKVDAMLKSVT